MGSAAKPSPDVHMDVWNTDRGWAAITLYGPIRPTSVHRSDDAPFRAPKR